jgi:hypothetical protein
MLKNDIRKRFEDLCINLIDNQVCRKFALNLLNDKSPKLTDFVDFEYSNKRSLAGLCKIHVNPYLMGIFGLALNKQGALPDILDFVAYLTDEDLEKAKFDLICKLLIAGNMPKILIKVIAQVDITELAVNVEWLNTFFTENAQRYAHTHPFLLALQEWIGDCDEYISLVDLINFPTFEVSSLATAFFKRSIGLDITDLKSFGMSRCVNVDPKKRISFKELPRHPYFDFEGSEAICIPKERDIVELANKLLEKDIVGKPKGYYSNALCGLLGERITAPISHALIQNKKQNNNQIHLFQVK